MSTLDENVYNQQSQSAPVAHQESVIHHQSYEALVVHQQSPIVFPQLDLGLVVPKFLPTDDLIECLNKAMLFITQEMLLQRSIDAITAKVMVTLQSSALNQRGHKIQHGSSDLDALDSDSDGVRATQTAFMANLSSYGLDVLSKVPNYNTYHDNTVFEQNVQEMEYSEQPVINNDSNIEITSDSNVISYDQYLKENKNEVVQSTPSPEQHNDMIIAVIEEMSNQVAKCNAVNQENKTIIVNINEKFAAFEKEIHTLKLNLSANINENKSVTTTIDVLKKETKEKEDKYIEEIVDLEKKKNARDNIVYKVGQSVQTMHMKHDVISMIDSEETLLSAEESQSKMNEKQNDPIFKEKKTSLLVTNSKPISKQPMVQPIQVKTDVPHELPTISLVKKSFKKLKSHLENFDKVVKVRTKVMGQNEDTWGFEHIRKAFEKNVIPFMKSLQESFQDFDKGLHVEINEMKAVFNQMESEVEQCFVERKCFEIQKKELFLKNDQLLELIISQDIMHTVVNSYDAIVD
ncbi:hypothetical protein Tco_0348655 [Tanacetum coccineum]